MTLNILWMSTNNDGGWLNELCIITSNGCATRALNLNEKIRKTSHGTNSRLYRS